MVDPYGRNINYLRLSLTDRCNMRCRYCMPAAGVPKLTHRQILSYEELLRIARQAVTLGIRKIRVTGGEPLVRKGVLPFLERLAQLPGLRELVLTTNGLLLKEMAADLRRVGVQRLNISLDSLNAETFRHMTRTGELSQVLAGIAAAQQAGFPLKLNVVAMRGFNDGEITDFARLTLERALSVRFIEYMPAVKEPNWQAMVMTGEEILARIGQTFRLKELERPSLAGPAREYRIAGALGTVGVITPLSEHFCSVCNRIRVTSTGEVKSCLFSAASFDLKPVLESGDDDALRAALARAIDQKGDRHQMSLNEAGHQPFAMAQIGG